jgi:hypothetical protein
MKLLLLYGPPAVGKLTIAKEIARLTEFKVFHAHLTVDLVASIFPRDAPRVSSTGVGHPLCGVRSSRASAPRRIDLYHSVWTRSRTVHRTECGSRRVIRRGSLFCASVVSYRDLAPARCQGRSQTVWQNNASVELLNETLRKREPQLLFEAATRWDSLSLNTDELRPVEAAQQVIAHYRLPTRYHNLTKASS